MPRSPQLCKDGSISILSSIEETEYGVRGRQPRCFWSQIPWGKRKCEKVRCRDATASSFSAQVREEVFAHFYTVAVNRHSSMRNCLFGLSGRIPCEQSP
jgi:hypothetical protein